MVVFHCYVSLPEGRKKYKQNKEVSSGKSNVFFLGSMLGNLCCSPDVCVWKFSFMKYINVVNVRCLLEFPCSHVGEKAKQHFFGQIGGKNMGHLLPWILMIILRITSLKWENLEVTPCLRLVEESWNIPKDGISQIPNISTICFPPRLVEIPQTVTCRLWRIVTPRNISRSPPWHSDEML